MMWSDWRRVPTKGEVLLGMGVIGMKAVQLKVKCHGHFKVKYQGQGHFNVKCLIFSTITTYT